MEQEEQDNPLKDSNIFLMQHTSYLGRSKNTIYSMFDS